MTLPDIDALSTYGGPLNNYAPIVDPTTDEDAASRNKYAMNVAMMTHMIPRAMRSFVGVAGATPTDPLSGLVHDALWGNGTGLKPVVGWSATGVWTCTWPATVVDELGVTHSVNLRRADAQVECGATKYDATASVTAPNVLTIRGWTAAGAANDLVGLVVSVWAW